MGLLGPKTPKPIDLPVDTGKPGKHHGGNLHSNPKTETTGKHGKPPEGGKK